MQHSSAAVRVLDKGLERVNTLKHWGCSQESFRSSLTTEASNRMYKSMILSNLEYCCAIFHGCGKAKMKKNNWNACRDELLG